MENEYMVESGKNVKRMTTRSKEEDHMKCLNVKRGVVRLDRKSGKGSQGHPKKGGLGGKFTWSGNNHDSSY